MLKQNVHKQVKELIKIIGGLSNDSNTLEDDLDYLRVCTKYFKFDLEACKRELKSNG